MQTYKRAKQIATAATIRSSRRLCVPACLLALFALPWPARSVHLGPLTAVSTIDFKGNNVTIDSFDSGDPHHSDWQTNWTYRGMNYGTYPTSPMAASGDLNTAEPYKRKDNAFVATDGSNLNIGHGQIYGYVDTAPGGVVAISAGGSVGDVFWVGSQQSGIQGGHNLNDMNVTFPGVLLPSGTYANVTKLTGGNVLNYAGHVFSYVITNSGHYRIDGSVN